MLFEILRQRLMTYVGEAPVAPCIHVSESLYLLIGKSRIEYYVLSVV